MERVIYDYCAVIGVDGMGNFNRVADTPALDGIFADSAVTYHALSMDPTISAENWGAMLLGMNPVIHGMTNGSISSNLNENEKLETVFSMLRKRFPDAYLASAVNWDPINYGIIEHDIDVDLVTAGNDEALTPLIVERVAKKPKFLYVQFDNVDGAGHSSDYGSENHLNQITLTDGYIKSIYEAYEKAEILDRTLFVVTADHGGFRHGHGGYTDAEKYVYLAAKGAGIGKSSIGYARTKDIAAIVLYALGAEVPQYDENGFSSQVPKGLFPWYDGEYIIPTVQPINAPSVETPDINGENGLLKYVDESKLKLALFFDGDCSDATGKNELRSEGLVKFYSNGMRSSCAELGQTGFLLADNPGIGKGSFSVCVWLKLDASLCLGACVVSTEQSHDGKRNGFKVILGNNDVKLELFENGRDTDIVTPFPGESAEGWLHLAAVADKESGKLSVYYNFKHAHTTDLSEDLRGDSFEPVLAIGSDVSGKRNREFDPCIFRLDDLLLFDGGLSCGEIAKLGEYYGF